MAENKNVQVVLKDVRISFCDAIWKPKKFRDQDDSKPRYSCSFLLDPKAHKKAIEEIKAAQRSVAAAKWPDGVPKEVKGDRIPLRDGNEKDYDGYAGKLYLAAAAPSNKRPKIVDGKKRPLIEEDGKPYAGCYVNAVVSIWADSRYGNRVCATLEAIQFARHGEPFAGKDVDIDEVFDEVEDDDKPFDDSDDSGGSEDASSLL